MVNGTIIPVKARVEITVASSKHKGLLTVLLDYGCIQCLISPGVVRKLGMRLRELKSLIAFSQLDETIAGGVSATFLTEQVELKIGTHTKNICFFVVPGMTETMMLGLAWLKKWNPSIDWERNWL